MLQNIQPLASSFRDPSGFVFEKDGILYRQVNKIFKENFDHFVNSGCYEHLRKNEWLIAHEEVAENLSGNDDWYKTLKPRRVPTPSYSYEWCFDMLKDAALLTLQLAKEAIRFGMILKDATPLNVQWLNGRPVFIDTLSFEKYEPSKPWIAYRQFCENFLSPLALMHHTRQPLQPLLLGYPEGIPLAVTRSLLPWRSRLSLHTYLHIHLHARLSYRNAGNASPHNENFSEKKLTRILESLETLVQRLAWKSKTPWAAYYDEAARRDDYVARKETIVAAWTEEIPGLKRGIDVGANEGKFSRLLAEKKIYTIAADIDAGAINRLYKNVKPAGADILPLVIDIANPSPAMGFDNKERLSFTERANADITLALALVHHLSIGKNIPFDRLVELFRILTNYLIIEFVPKQDEWVQSMLRQKKDIYQGYDEESFLDAFSRHFHILKKETLGNSERTIYLMKNAHK